MADAVKDLDPATVAAAIEANINAHLLSFARLPGAVLHDDARLTWVDSGGPLALFNSVVHADLGPEAVDAEIEAVLAHFRRHDRPFTWQIGPTTRPADLGRSLLAHGLTFNEDEPGMAVTLDRVRADADAPPGLTIETVRDEPGLEAWVDVWLFPLPGEVRPLFVDALRERGLADDLPWRLYLGRLDGEPVAISELFEDEGVVGVQHVVTLPAARRRGIGTAMTLRVLHDARAMGCRVGALTASPEGIGIYRRIGFREYCRFRRYEWENGGNDSG